MEQAIKKKGIKRIHACMLLTGNQLKSVEKTEVVTNVINRKIMCLYIYGILKFKFSENKNLETKAIKNANAKACRIAE
ncbi:MAG: hypothetical protein FWD40_11620 [Treponema sp.]|nr:hypothetical protein [Treponema sp.]